MTAQHDRRQGRRRRRCGQRVAEAAADFAQQHGPRARASPPSWSARIRRAPSMSARRARRPPKRAWRASRTSLPADVARPSCSPWSTGSTPTTRSTASWSSCRCRRRSTQHAVIAAIDPAKDVDGFHPVNAGRLAIGPRRARALHAARLPASCSSDELGDLGGKDAVVDRPLEHRRQADGAAAARRELHRDHRPFAHPRPARCRAPRRHRRRRGRPPGDGPAATGSSPARRSSTSASTACRQTDGKRGWSATSTSTSASEVAGAITPVPGGVGPMTIAMLLRNTLVAAHRRAGLA